MKMNENHILDKDENQPITVRRAKYGYVIRQAEDIIGLSHLEAKELFRLMSEDIDLTPLTNLK